MFYVPVSESTPTTTTTTSTTIKTISTTGNLRNCSNFVSQHFLKFSLSKHCLCKELFY